MVVAGLLFQRSLPEVDPFHYAPRVTIPVLMLNGKYDFFFPCETSHSFPSPEMARESLAWLDEYLGPVAAAR